MAIRDLINRAKAQTAATETFVFFVGHGIEVRFSRDRLAALYRIAVNAMPNETGGILVAKVNDARGFRSISVTDDMTPKDSKGSESLFTRGTKGLAKWLGRKARRGEVYIGEWHSHTDLTTEASKVDADMMQTLSETEGMRQAEPVLLIFGGDGAACYVWRGGRLERLKLSV